MNQCFNIVYLAGCFTHALNDVLHGAERERLGVPVFKLAKDHWYPAPRELRQDFLGVGVKLYAICFQRMMNNCACLVVFDSDSWFWSASIPCPRDMAGNQVLRPLEPFKADHGNGRRFWFIMF
jgi:hypothetical protein